MYGQSSKENFTILWESPDSETVLSFPDSSTECCVSLPVLAESTRTNDLYNDSHGIIFFWNKAFISATLWLQKQVSGVWTDLEELDVNTWSTNLTSYDPTVFGFFENRYGQKAIGYQLDWQKVLDDKGEGTYRIKSVGSTLISGDEIEKYSLEFCLLEYTHDRADETVRINFWQNGNIGDSENDKLKIDFGTLNWFNQIRLPGAKFGFDTSQFEQTFTKYQNGQMKWTADNQVEEYILKTGRYDNELHRFIKTRVLQADEISITDYNISNATRHFNRFVIRAGNYEPVWSDFSNLAPVEIKFQQAYQNLTHKRK